MNAPCSLPSTITIRILSKGKRPVLLRKLHASSACTALRENDGPVGGINRIDGWMLISHPRDGVGLVGLPLCGRNSWESAFDDDLIDIETRASCADPWKLLEDWSDLPLEKLQP